MIILSKIFRFFRYGLKISFCRFILYLDVIPLFCILITLITLDFGAVLILTKLFIVISILLLTIVLLFGFSRWYILPKAVRNDLSTYFNKYLDDYDLIFKYLIYHLRIEKWHSLSETEKKEFADLDIDKFKLIMELGSVEIDNWLNLTANEKNQLAKLDSSRLEILIRTKPINFKKWCSLSELERNQITNLNLDDFEMIMQLESLVFEKWRSLSWKVKSRLACLNLNKIKEILELKLDDINKLDSISDKHIEQLFELSTESLKFILQQDSIPLDKLLATFTSDTISKTLSYISNPEMEQFYKTLNINAIINHLKDKTESYVNFISLTEALQSKYIDNLSMIGAGLYNLIVSFKLLFPEKKHIYIPLSTIFMPSGNCQTMAASKTIKIEVSDVSNIHKEVIPVVCTEYHKSVPESNDTFISLSTANEKLRNILAIAEFCGVSPFVTQMATWILTDGINLDKFCLYRPTYRNEIERLIFIQEGEKLTKEIYPKSIEKYLARRIVQIAEEII